jgi:hypothetical protein
LPNVKEQDKQEALANDEMNRPHPSHEIPPSVKALKLEHGHFQQHMVGKPLANLILNKELDMPRYGPLSIGRANLYT